MNTIGVSLRNLSGRGPAPRSLPARPGSAGEQVGLVDHHHDARPASLMWPATCASCAVMPSSASRSEDADVGALDGPPRHDHGQHLGTAVGAPLAADAGGVDQAHAPTAAPRARCRRRRGSCPGTSETMTRSSPSSRLRSDDLPTLGRPTMAIASSRPRRLLVLRRRAGTARSRPTARRCRGRARPRSRRAGTPGARNSPEPKLGVAPVGLVDDQHHRLAGAARTASAISRSAGSGRQRRPPRARSRRRPAMATRAWPRIRAGISASPSGSKPPVSTRMTLPPPGRCASATTRSRVTPGRSWVIDRRRRSDG